MHTAGHRFPVYRLSNGSYDEEDCGGVELRRDGERGRVAGSFGLRFLRSNLVAVWEGDCAPSPTVSGLTGCAGERHLNSQAFQQPVGLGGIGPAHRLYRSFASASHRLQQIKAKRIDSTGEITLLIYAIRWCSLSARLQQTLQRGQQSFPPALALCCRPEKASNGHQRYPRYWRPQSNP